MIQEVEKGLIAKKKEHSTPINKHAFIDKQWPEALYL